MRRWRARQRARGLKVQVTWVAKPDQASEPPLEQRLLEARQLVLCVMAVEKIERDNALLGIVHRNFQRWQQRDSGVPGGPIRAWRKLLRLSWPQIAARLTEQSPQGLRLRAMTPLFGVLSARERRRIAGAFDRRAHPLSQPAVRKLKNAP
jgi:hypothetical protein